LPDEFSALSDRVLDVGRRDLLLAPPALAFTQMLFDSSDSAIDKF
jgi:hypothetical protein